MSSIELLVSNIVLNWPEYLLLILVMIGSVFHLVIFLHIFCGNIFLLTYMRCGILPCISHMYFSSVEKEQFIYDLPARLGKCIKSEAYADAVRLYTGAMPIFKVQPFCLNCFLRIMLLSSGFVLMKHFYLALL